MSMERNDARLTIAVTLRKWKILWVNWIARIIWNYNIHTELEDVREINEQQYGIPELLLLQIMLIKSLWIGW